MTALRTGRPLWLGRDPHERTQTYPSLHGHQDADVAIIGGGITGSAIAARFASAGVRTAVVESALAGRGSTAASSALLLRDLDLGLAELGRLYGAAKARRIWQLSAGAARDFAKAVRRLNIRCELTPQDSIFYTTSPDTVHELRSEYERRRKAGFRAEWLTPGALRQVAGIAGRGAIRTRDNAHLNPLKASLGFLRAAARAGAAVFERSPVRSIETVNDAVCLVTARGSLRAQRVIIATGYATPMFKPLAGRFRMYRTYVLATTPLDKEERRELGLDRVMLWEKARPYHYARWTTDRRLLLGGEDQPVARGRGRIAAFRKGTRELREHFERLLPVLADIEFDYAWEGLFAMTPDGLPYIGAHRRYPRHLFALGYGGNGMTFALLAARMLLEQWQGIHSPDHDLFAFGRHGRA
jgi:glycine/D-amino acid oxidase-like deaminating enzyme